MNEKLLLNMDDVAAALAVKRSTAWELVRSGALPSVKIGARRLVRSADLRAYVEGLTS